MAEKKTVSREVSPYDPSAVARLVKVVTSETHLTRRGDAYDLSKPARPAGWRAHKSKA